MDVQKFIDDNKAKENVERWERLTPLMLKIKELYDLELNKGHVTTEQIKRAVKDKLTTLTDEEEKYFDSAYKVAIKSTEKEIVQQKKKEKKVVTDIQKSFYVKDKQIFEQIYINGESKFLKYDQETKKFEYVQWIEDGDKEIYPIQGQEIDKKVVLLPSGYKECTVAELDARCIKFIHKYLDVDKMYEKLSAWNIRLSWVYDRFHTLNYLRALGDTGTGKSRFLDTIGMINYKPIMCSGAATSAPIFRLTDKWNGTLVIDEADQEQSDETNMLIKIFNCGYERGRAVIRCDKNDPNKVEFYEVFCPKVIATRKRFHDKATEARCMTRVMTQTVRKDIPPILTKEFYAEAEELRQMYLYYRMTHYFTIDPEAGMKTDLSMYEPRLQQVHVGFVSLFCEDEQQMIGFRKYLDEYQRMLIEERSETYEGLVVKCIYDMVLAKKEHITPKLISDKCNEEHVGKYQANAIGIGKTAKILGLTFKRIRAEEFGESKIVNSLIFVPDILIGLFERYVGEDENFGAAKELVLLRGTDVTVAMGTRSIRNNPQTTPQIDNISLSPPTTRNTRNKSEENRGEINVTDSVTEAKPTVTTVTELANVPNIHISTIMEKLTKIFANSDTLETDQIFVFLDAWEFEKAKVEGLIMEVRPDVWRLNK
jgi:hypothetical protein